jgi:GT2 family glycosyltransferase
MRSISNLSYPDLEVIIVGRPDYLPEYAGAKTISPPEQRFWNGRGINYGVEHSSGEYLFIVNDDCVLEKDCVQSLVAWAAHGMNVMPAGNDMQGRYYCAHYARDLNDKTIGLDSVRPVQAQVLVFADTLCLYAHMCSRELWDKVGPMDDNSGLIDIDWCLRVRHAGHMNAIELSSLVWHFGGSSVGHTLDDTKRLKQREQFKRKWGWVP